MAHSCEGLKITEIAKLPGVSDLSMQVRGRFAQALQAESQGDHTKAQQKLDEACDAEQAQG